MEHHSEAFVALDTAKLRNAVAIADAGRNGEVRYLGEFDNTEVATRKLVAQLASKHARLAFCYEAGPTGYGLYRLIKSLGHDCIVVAPSLIPSKPGDRVKTNRRDAVNLAKLLRAGELTAVWVPDERHEAMRDLVRARDAAVKDYKIKRQNVSSLLLRLGRHYPGKKTWGRAHINWLTSLKLEHREQRIAFEEMLLAVRQVRERIERLEQAMREAVADWTLAPVIEAVQALRGIDMVGAVTFLAELGDLSQAEEVGTGGVHAAERFLSLFCAEPRRIGDHHLSEPDDGVKRCAQLVAHADHELRFVLARQLELMALMRDLVEQPRVLNGDGGLRGK